MIGGEFIILENVRKFWKSLIVVSENVVSLTSVAAMSMERLGISMTHDRFICWLLFCGWQLLHSFLFLFSFFHLRRRY